MFRKIIPLSVMSILVCFTWLVLSPVSYAAPPKKPVKTERVNTRKLPPRKEKVKKAPTVDKKKEPTKNDRRVPDSKQDKAQESWEKTPAEKEVKSTQEEKKVETKEAYDYFRDTNGDGIDDRLKEKKTKEEKVSEEKDKPSP